MIGAYLVITTLLFTFLVVTIYVPPYDAQSAGPQLAVFLPAATFGGITTLGYFFS